MFEQAGVFYACALSGSFFGLLNRYSSDRFGKKVSRITVHSVNVKSRFPLILSRTLLSVFRTTLEMQVLVHFRKLHAGVGMEHKVDRHTALDHQQEHGRAVFAPGEADRMELAVLRAGLCQKPSR